VWTADPSADGRRSAAICESNCHRREAYRLAASGANLVSLLFLLAQRYAGAVKAHESCNCCHRLSASNCGCMSVYNQPAGSTQPCIPPGSLNQSSTGFGGNVTSAGWQVTLCDPIWHVSSRSGEACCKLSVYRFFTIVSIPCRSSIGWTDGRWFFTETSFELDFWTEQGSVLSYFRGLMGSTVLMSNFFRIFLTKIV